MAFLGTRGMALVGLLPNGRLSILWLFPKAGLPKRKETHPEGEHLLLHSKVKPSDQNEKCYVALSHLVGKWLATHMD